MMIRIKLTPEAREEVERTFKTTPDRRLRERCQAVLMADRGRRRGPIAEDLGVHRASVHRWLRAYQAGGLAGLRIRWAAGPPPRIPEDRAATIVTWVKEGPQGCGLERANWTYAELAAHLYHVHGIEVRETAMRAFRRRHGVRPYRADLPLPARRSRAPRGGTGGTQKKPSTVSACCSAKTRPASRWCRRCARRSGSRATGRGSAPGTTRARSTASQR